LEKARLLRGCQKVTILTALMGDKEKKYGGTLRGVMEGQVMKYSVDQLNDLANFIASM